MFCHVAHIKFAADRPFFLHMSMAHVYPYIYKLVYRSGCNVEALVAVKSLPRKSIIRRSCAPGCVTNQQAGRGQGKRKEEARKAINLLALDGLTKCLTAPRRLHYLHSYLMPMEKANIKCASA
jgi:hypothetical protein